tara:strand:- start:212 stop:817 length:606 start_codon:yes stop_codon:yes gene_type:complete
VKSKFYIKLSIFFLIFIISYFFYQYLNQGLNLKSSKNISIEKKDSQKSDELRPKNKQQNIIEKIHYKSQDLNNNIYIIKSERGSVDPENSNMIYMQFVEGIIKLNNNEKILITSNKAKFNNENYETNFYENVNIKFKHHKANAEKLDLSFEKKYLIMKNNLKYNNQSVNIISDAFEIDFNKKVSKLFMNKKENTIKITNIK